MGVPKDITKAVEWYRKAADQGYANAQCKLGYCYENGLGVSKDASKAGEWYRKAAEQGLAWAQYNFGVCYYNGIGVRKNYSTAVEWFRKAADQGYTSAQEVLGRCYKYGHGVPKNLEQSTLWYMKAADQKDENSQINLSIVKYELGEQQYKEENYSEAFKNLKAAAESQINPIPQAMTLLAGCYEYGYGTTADIDKARYWREQASKFDDEAAQRALTPISDIVVGAESDNTPSSGN